MKVPSINSIVNKYLTVLTFWVTFLWRIKVIRKLFLGRMSTHLMTHLRPQINFEKNYLLATIVIWEKTRHYVINRLDLLKNTLLEYNAQPAKQNLFLEIKNEARHDLGDSRKRYHARGQKKKIWTVLGANQIAGFVTVSSEKKKKFLSLVMQIPKKYPNRGIWRAG